MPIIVQSPTPTDEEGVTTTFLPHPSISQRKGRLERWIEGQHAHPDAHENNDMIAPGSSQDSHPYLAYSNARRARSASCGDDSGSITESFVLVDGDDETGEPRREELNVFEEVRYTSRDNIAIIYSGVDPHPAGYSPWHAPKYAWSLISPSDSAVSPCFSFLFELFSPHFPFPSRFLPYSPPLFPLATTTVFHGLPWSRSQRQLPRSHAATVRPQ